MHRYTVRHGDHFIASLHAVSAVEACVLACEMVSDAPRPQDCTAVVAHVGCHGVLAEVDRLALQPVRATIGPDEELMIADPAGMAQAIREAVAAGREPPVRAICYRFGAAAGLPGVVREEQHPTGHALLVDGIGTLSPNSGDWVFLDDAGRPYQVMTEAELLRRHDRP